MADPADLGNDRAEQLLADALARHKRAAGLQLVSALWCEDCGETIPALRRKLVAGCQACIECQQIREVRRG